jgi:anaphase-promoting complex subunit 8
MLEFCAITIMLDLHTATDLVTNMITELLEVFPGSVHLKAQRALVYYHMRREWVPYTADTQSSK